MSEVLEPVKVKKLAVQKILPYINEESDNMGLTKYHMVLHDGMTHKESITCLEKHGVKRWITGLDEFAPEINLLTGDDKIAVIKDIRTKVIFLEKRLGANLVDIDDEKFWDKVKTVHPTNHAFWNEITIEPSNEPGFLNPENPHDLIKICAIEAGGFSIVAKSYEDAQLSPNPPKFYLHKAIETAGTKVEVKKIKNKSIELLSKLSEKGGKRLFYIAKVIDINGHQYKYDTPQDVIYDYLDEYINGKGTIKIVKTAAISFNTAAELSESDVRIKAVISDASFYKMITAKADGLLYHVATDTILGKNAAEVLTYFKNTMNTKLWDVLFSEVEAYWKE